MSLDTGTTAHQGSGATRIAWLVSFLVPALVLLVLLAGAQKSHSAVVLPPPPPPPAETEEPEEEGEEEEEGEDVGGAEWEEEDDGGFATSPYPPDECVLRTARARLFAYTARDRVRLVVRYTSLAPARVTVAYWLKGAKGPLTLGKATQRFEKKGLFRATERLTAAQMEKVRAARSFQVDMRIPAAPRHCEQYHSRHLTIKRTVENQVVWFQSDSIFGTGR